MTALADLLPDANVLGRAEGVERALRRGRRLGLVGWVLLAFSVAQASAAAIAWGQGLGSWPMWLAVGLVVVSFMLIAWTRIWIRESRTPFRYTYSIAAFTPVEDAGEIKTLEWMRHDLAERLSRRIGRLTLLREEDVTAERAESHVHVSGVYGVRPRADGAEFVEVSPWVRIGAIDSDATLAHPVKFRRRATAAEEPLTVADYEKLVERVYFSVATEIYGRVRKDVERKIGLLPTTYLRATAYFHEAEDYARSRTLDAYDDARELYLGVLRLYEPDWRAPVVGRCRTWVRGAGRWIASARQQRRRLLARVWRRAAKVELMIARAEIGYARTLLDRRILAKLSGQRVNSAFETLHVTRSAIERLEALPRDVSGCEDALFYAYTTAALASSTLGSPTRAKGYLERARELDPGAAANSAHYQFVASELEPSSLVSLDIVRRAVDLDPDLEVAQFSLAFALEMLWRTRQELEPSVARTVIAEYERVLEINPGNIGAWANIGYLEWLLRNADEAEHAFERGREYKEIKHETVVWELDHGLARIAAERGDFARAYDAYVATAGAMTEAAGREDVSAYHFASIDLALVGRFREYAASVRAHARARTRLPPTDETTRRARNSVLAFVLNDYAAACVNYYGRTGETRHHSRARRLLNRAARLNPRYAVISYNRYLVDSLDPDSNAGRAARRNLERAVSFAPNWPRPALDLVYEDVREMQALNREAYEENAAADAETERANQLRAQANALTKQVTEGVEAGRGRAPAAAGTAGAEQHGAPPEHPPEDDLDFHFRGDRRRVLLEEPDVHARRREATDAALRAKNHDEAAEAARGRAVECRARADAYAREAQTRLKALLPHRWLWIDRAAGTFDWDAPFRDDVRRELRLEREHSDLQAAALCRWCEVALEDEKTAVRARELLEHVERRLLPDDETLLATLMRLNPTAASEYKKRLWEITRRSLLEDPQYWRVRLADPPRGADFVEIVNDLGSRRNVTPGVLVAAGEQLTSVGQHEEALRLFERARDRDYEREMSDLHDPGWYARRIAQARWSAGHEREAIAELRSAPAHDGEGNWRTELVWALLSTESIETESGFRLLQSWLLGEAARAPDDAGRALATLHDGRYTRLVRGHEAGPGDVLPPPPVVLELDAPLFVRADLRDDLPELLRDIRHEVHRRTRVSIEVIPIIPAGAWESRAGDRYRLLVFDRVVAEGTVPAEKVRAPVGPLRHALTEALFDHLGDLVDVDAAAAMLDEWARADRRRSAMAMALVDDDAALVRFTRVVRLLLAEHVPLQDLGSVLEELAAAPTGATTEESTTRVRRRLRRELTEVVLGMRMTEAPADALELLRLAGTSGKALTPFDAMVVRAALRAQLGDDGALPPALLVDNTDLRAAVSSLARRERPSLFVVERDELIGEQTAGTP